MILSTLFTSSKSSSSPSPSPSPCPAVACATAFCAGAAGFAEGVGFAVGEGAGDEDGGPCLGGEREDCLGGDMDVGVVVGEVEAGDFGRDFAFGGLETAVGDVGMADAGDTGGVRFCCFVAWGA